MLSRRIKKRPIPFVIWSLLTIALIYAGGLISILIIDDPKFVSRYGHDIQSVLVECTPFWLSLILTSWLVWRPLPEVIGHCEFCGYNLQGNESGKCPECGKPAGADEICSPALGPEQK